MRVRTNNSDGPVLALHEVLLEELGDFEPLDQEDQQDFAHYQRLAAEADIRRKEREAVWAGQNAKAEDREAICQLARNAELRCLHPLYSILHRRERSALCFSGGGIRSATFSLGVLQRMAKHSLPPEGSEQKPHMLAEFDFLSTVSGGGYIGSWFSSWVQRAGMASVLRQLAHRTAGKVDPEAKPILYLRDYTNYLSPRLGLFTGDTWTLVATTVRNILLNWLVLLPFVGAALLVPVLFNLLLRHPLFVSFDWLLWVGFALGVTGTGSLLHGLPSFGNGRHGQKTFAYSCLVPLLVASVCIATWWCWLPDARARTLPRLNIALFGAGMHFGGVLLAIVFSKLAHSENFNDENFKPLRLAFATIASVLTGALGAWLVSLVARGFHPQSDMGTLYFACFAVPLVLATLMAVGVFSVGISSKITNDDDREWWSRAGAWVLIAGIGWLAFFCNVLLLPIWILSLAAKWKAGLSALSAAVGWYVTQTGARSDSHSTPGSSQSADKSPSMMSKLNHWALPVGSILFLIAMGLTITLANQQLAIRLHNVGVPFATAFLMAFEVAIALLASYCVNVNKFSLHAMYRMRLIRAYLGASNAQRKPNPFTGFDANDNIPMQKLSAEKPLHVLNLCLNLVSGAKLAWQQRKAEPFTVTRLHAGSFRVGYQPSSMYGHGNLPGGITLGTAMAISGAAASPNMGYHSSPLAAIVMTLFNARLGWWLANAGEAGRRFWDRDGPAFGIRPFLDEALGNTDDENRYIYLSDGGHFENLGIYEMVVRRCKHIVVIDAGADNDYTKEDLGNAVRKIRIDLGISIEFPFGVEIDRQLGSDGKRCALAKIRYDLIDEGAKAGELLYIKPVMTGREPADVKNYESANPDFPQEPTSDQWFSESQFESYRRLGMFSIEEIAGTDDPLSVPELFRRAARYLSNRPASEYVQSAIAGGPV